VKKWIVIPLLLLLLTGCTQPRVLTELPDGELVEYVELRDGYLHFTDQDVVGGPHMSTYSPAGMRVVDTPDYQDIVADLGMDPIEMSKTLPEKYHLTYEALQDVLKRSGHYPAGGYSFLLRGDPGEYYITDIQGAYPTFCITLKRMTGDEPNFWFYYFPRHDHWPQFRVFPWEIVGGMEKDNIYHSEVNGQEVGVMYDIQTIKSRFPGVEWEYFYGGFYAGDLAVTIETNYSYCTQAEFVEVFLAIFDYLTALKE